MELKDVLVVGNKKNNCNGSVQQDGLTPYLRQMSVQSSLSSSSSMLKAERGPHRDRRRERLNTELLGATINNDIKTVERLLDEGASVNATCRQNKKTALHLAASKGYDPIISLLISRGGNAEARDSLGRQPIHLAAWYGHMDTIATFGQQNKDLLSSPIRKQDINISEGDLDSWNHKHDERMEYPSDFNEGSTPLHLVSKRSNVTCVNFLLHLGVSVEAKDSLGLTPLDVVGANDDHLNNLTVGAPSTPSTLNTPSIRPSPTGFVSYDSISFRPPLSPAQMPKVINPLNITTNTPTLVEDVKRTCEFISKKACVTSIAKSLLDKGAKMPASQFKEGYVRNQSKPQRTALHTAVDDDNVELIKLLLEQNGCMLSWNDQGDTPLHLAVKNRSMEPLKTMLSWQGRGPEIVDVRNLDGCTLLHMAVMTEWGDGVSLLLENGADVKTTSNLKETVFHLAAERGNSKMLEELLSVGDAIKVLEYKDRACNTPLCKAVENCSLDCAKLLVNNGADPNYILPGDRSLIHLCTENGKNSTDLLRYFLTQTSAKDKKDMRSRPEKGGMTPLQYASKEGFDRCVNTLLKAGCDVKLESTDDPHMGSTALHLAAKNGHDTVVHQLLSSDSDVLTHKNSKGWYPLHIAASNGHSKCISTMIGYGADLSDYIIDEKGVHLTGLEIIMYCIPQPCEFLVQVFDSYIKINDYPMSDPNCEIKVKFDVLTPKQNSCKQLRVLSSLLNCGNDQLHERLLLHPIVQTFLHLKWRKLRLFFFIIMFFYLIFTISLTSLAVWYYIQKKEPTIITKVIQGILFGSLLPIILAEGLNFAQLQRYYLIDYESWVKWAVFGCSMIVGLADPNQWWARYVAAITVLLAWIELLFLVARCPNWGFYVLMFSRVATKVLKVLVTFTFLLVGFTFAFMILFDGEGPFSTVWQSTVKIFVMMLEFDYEATFENLPDSNWLSFMSRIMFLFFIVLVAIVLMNLMVGLAVSDIAVLETQGRTQRLAKQVNFLSILEILVGTRSVLAYLPRRARMWAENRKTVMPEVIIRAGGTTMDCEEACLPRNIREAIIEKMAALNQKQETVSITSKVSRGMSRLDSLEQRNMGRLFSDVDELKILLNKQADENKKLQNQLQVILNKLSKADSSNTVRNEVKPSYVNNAFSDSAKLA